MMIWSIAVLQETTKLPAPSKRDEAEGSAQAEDDLKGPKADDRLSALSGKETHAGPRKPAGSEHYSVIQGSVRDTIAAANQDEVPQLAETNSGLCRQGIGSCLQRGQPLDTLDREPSLANVMEGIIAVSNRTAEPEDNQQKEKSRQETQRAEIAGSNWTGVQGSDCTSCPGNDSAVPAFEPTSEAVIQPGNDANMGIEDVCEDRNVQLTSLESNPMFATQGLSELPNSHADTPMPKDPGIRSSGYSLLALK